MKPRAKGGVSTSWTDTLTLDTEELIITGASRWGKRLWDRRVCKYSTGLHTTTTTTTPYTHNAHAHMGEDRTPRVTVKGYEQI